jgi:hypothetical protein
MHQPVESELARLGPIVPAITSGWSLTWSLCHSRLAVCIRIRHGNREGCVRSRLRGMDGNYSGCSVADLFVIRKMSARQQRTASLAEGRDDCLVTIVVVRYRRVAPQELCDDGLYATEVFHSSIFQ